MGAKLQSFFFLSLSRETWQGPRFRKLLSHTAPELWYFNSLSLPLPWEHIIMWSLVMGKLHWVSRFESVPEVESFSFLTTPNLPHFPLFICWFTFVFFSWFYLIDLGMLFNPLPTFHPRKKKGKEMGRGAWVPSWSFALQACHLSLVMYPVPNRTVIRPHLLA